MPTRKVCVRACEKPRELPKIALALALRCSRGVPYLSSHSSVVVALATGSSLALASLAHCALMCGPLAAASHARGGSHGRSAYFVGRLVSYVLLGALAGSLFRVLGQTPWARWAETALSWSLGATLLYTAWRSVRRPERSGLVKLGTAPRKSLIGRALARVADDPLLLGVATALLPCGALFTALAGAAAQGDPLLGSLVMGTFATFTGVSVIGVSHLTSWFSRTTLLRWTTSVVLVVGGLIFLYRPLPVLRAAQGEVPACHAPSSSAQVAR